MTGLAWAGAARAAHPTEVPAVPTGEGAFKAGGRVDVAPEAGAQGRR